MDEDLKEVLEMMLEQMQIMEKQIEALNEKQNRDSNNELREDVPTDSSKQIHIPGL